MFLEVVVKRTSVVVIIG